MRILTPAFVKKQHKMVYYGPKQENTEHKQTIRMNSDMTVNNWQAFVIGSMLMVMLTALTDDGSTDVCSKSLSQPCFVIFMTLSH